MDNVIQVIPTSNVSTEEATSTKFYIPTLDGIRAVAVTLVFIAHAGLGHLVPGGFGVTIFFFLSGYLITSLLRVEYESKRSISMKNFYLRRVYRIFPPMYLILSLVLALSALGVVGGSKSLQLEPILAQVFYITNYYLIANGGDVFPAGTGVLWSLAIEEHFYLLYPVVLALLLRTFTYRQIAAFFLAFNLMVLVWRCVLVFGFDVADTYTYMATDARIDSLLWGCILGLVFNPHLDKQSQQNASEVMIFVGSLGVLAFTLLYRDENFRETLRYTLQGVALLPIFYLSIRHTDWPIFRLLSLDSMRWYGRISYTFYLFHLTGLTLAGYVTRDDKLIQGILGWIITVLFSVAVYHLVEKHFMRLRHGLHREN